MTTTGRGTISGPADVSELEKLPFEQAVAARSTYDLLRASAAAVPERWALTFLPSAEPDVEPERLTHAELFARVTQAANLFAELGVGADDVVSFLLPSLIETHLAFWGAEAAGAANPINFLLSAEHIAEIMNAVETKVLVTLGPHPDMAIWPKVEAIRERVPSLRAVLTVGQGVPASDDFSAALAACRGDSLLSGRDIGLEDVASYFHTGGTTGAPKLALHSQQNEVHIAWCIGRMSGLRAHDVSINGLPLFHVAGVLVVGLAGLAAGGELVMPTAAGLRHPGVIENYWRIVERFGATVIGGIPTSMAALLNVPADGCDIRSVRIAQSGGAPIPVALKQNFKQAFGIDIFEGYGMTESSGLIVLSPTGGPPRYEYSGIPLPWGRVEVRQNLPDEGVGESLPAGQTGVIVYKGANVTPGYLGAAATTGRTEDGWFISGDLGHLSEDGWLAITGRAKDVIIRSGHNIDPAMIEEALQNHSAVETCAAVGQPDGYAGEVPVVYAVLKPEALATAEELQEFMADHIAERPALPKAVYLLDEMPLTAVAKIFKPALRLDAARRVFTAALAPLAAEGIAATVEVSTGNQASWQAVVTLEGGGGGGRQATEAQVQAALGVFDIGIDTIWS
ncbi:MAG TPA: acyl-CoA synthetase [Alphaproteobacteria bacterium]|jgi:fatty-acyl-CoA synthase|nr:acyl-CoA synthetase [Alphaproteobacteria bacterium]